MEPSPCSRLSRSRPGRCWLNQVERLFAKITTEQIRRNSSRSVPHLRPCILDYIDDHNRDPKPFKWTASADIILGKVEHLCSKLA